MTTPAAPILSVKPARTTRTVVVACPYCKRQHRHGWPYTAPTVGSRVAHCGQGSYRVTGEAA